MCAQAEYVGKFEPKQSVEVRNRKSKKNDFKISNSDNNNDEGNVMFTEDRKNANNKKTKDNIASSNSLQHDISDDVNVPFKSNEVKIAFPARKKSKLSFQSDDIKHSSIRWVANLSLMGNILLFIVKIVVYALTLSISVVASLVDSLVDLITQAVLFWTERNVSIVSETYPVGRTRLEPVAISGISVLMMMASLMVIREAIGQLILPLYVVSFDIGTIVAMSCVIAIKLALWIYCQRFKYSPTAMALAEDHMNDVCSNSVAVVCGIIASYFPRISWLDPAGGVAISIYIIVRWSMIGYTEMKKLVGCRANDEIINEVRTMCEEHHQDMEVDVCRVYHVGRNVLVEVEVTMPGNTPLQVAHDVSLALQKKIETLNYVERAFVHVDYEKRRYDEHKRPYLA